MARRFGWDEAAVTAEVAAYEREVEETLVPVSAID